MLFDVLITEITNPRARPILIRYLAHDPSVSLHAAQSLLDHLPLPYARGVNEEEAKSQLVRLQKIGVRGRIVASTQQPNHPATPSTARIRPHDVAPTYHRQPHTPAVSTAALFAETSTRQRKRSIAVVAGFAVILILGALISLKSARRFTGRQSSSSLPIATTAQRESPIPSKNHRPNAPDIPPAGTSKTLSGPHRARSQLLTDSARSLGTTIDAIKFYQAAISFNERNFDAWQGLLMAYREQDMYQEAAQTRTRMIEVFGDEVFSLQAIIQRYGRPLELAREKTTLRIEYQTSAHLRQELIAETYSLMRALQNACGCEALSIFAHSKKGGVLSYLPVSPFPATRDEYEKAARLTFL